MQDFTIQSATEGDAAEHSNDLERLSKTNMLRESADEERVWLQKVEPELEKLEVGQRDWLYNCTHPLH